MRQWKRITAAIMVCLLTCMTSKTDVSAATDKMKIVSIDLGQENTGEATMISDGKGKSLLLDSGDNHNDSVFKWLNKNGYRRKKFDTLVTHWHDDHAGNTAKIIERYNVGTVYLPSTSYVYKENSDYYRYERGYATRILAAAKKHGTKVVYLKKGKTIKVGSVKGKVLSVNALPKKQRDQGNVHYFNNQSAVIMFSGGGAKFLAAGDSQKELEEKLVKSRTSLKADIYKLSHHGYDGSNNKMFVDAISPALAYFSNYLSTPSKYTRDDIRGSVNRVEKTANVMSARYNGTITYICQGGNIRVKAGRNVKKMYQRVINKKTNKAQNITIAFNKASKIHSISSILNTKEYYNRQLNAKGSMFTGKWVKKNNKYMLRSNGIFAYNTFAKAKSGVYWFNSKGYRSGKGFISAYGRKYYMMPKRATGFKTIKGKSYYFMDKSYAKYKSYLEGMMMTGWQTINGKRYYLGSDGVVRRGWQVLDGKRYYLGSDGAVRKGWQTINGKRYYLGSDGVARKGWQTINGVRYQFDADGALVNNAAPAQKASSVVSTVSVPKAAPEQKKAPAPEIIEEAPADQVQSPAQAVTAEETVAAPAEEVEAAPVEETEAAQAEEIEAVPVEETEAVPVEETEAAPAEETEAVQAEEIEAVPVEETEAAPAEEIGVTPAEETEAVQAEEVEAAPAEEVRTEETAVEVAPEESIETEETAGSEETMEEEPAEAAEEITEKPLRLTE